METGSRFLSTEHSATQPNTTSPSHGGGHQTGSTSLFGALLSISPTDGTLAILITVALIVLFETLFHKMQGLTKDTPFQDMVSAIEKELMIVGCLAFLFKVILNANSLLLSHEWTHALEFAGTK